MPSSLTNKGLLLHSLISPMHAKGSVGSCSCAAKQCECNQEVNIRMCISSEVDVTSEARTNPTHKSTKSSFIKAKVTHKSAGNSFLQNIKHAVEGKQTASSYRKPPIVSSKSSKYLLLQTTHQENN